ncbi:uncharacterized protein LOC119282357 isoform X1 [Triticum dicoccoides]|uniref:uncharacterized protein LOC119282357 isoform X1 n=1 Tax=Triticum dicoccoides TaxID=85692 RepID=UPI00188DED19|nr:uncharacterized protein LOC119282357 isoform X1 [Triticum dicoccoides]
MQFPLHNPHIQAGAMFSSRSSRLQYRRTRLSDSEENCRLLRSMEDPVQKGCKRSRGKTHLFTLGDGQTSSAADLARARLRKKKMWMQYLMKKKVEGWSGVFSGVLLEG